MEYQSSDTFTDSLAQCCRGPGDVGNADRLADGLGTALDDAQRLIRSMKPTKRSPPPTHLSCSGEGCTVRVKVAPDVALSR